MTATAYRFRFNNDIGLDGAQETLLLAELAACGIFGESRVRADGRYCIDETINTIVIDAQTAVGMVVSLIFSAFASAEYGNDSFSVRRVQLLPDGQCINQ